MRFTHTYRPEAEAPLSKRLGQGGFSPLLRMILLLVLLTVFAAGCVDSPRTKADDWAKRFPEEIACKEEQDGEETETIYWEFDERQALTAETQSRYGQVVLLYECDEAVAQIDIKSFATVNAADIAKLEALRDWQVRGVRFARESASSDIRCEEAYFPDGSALSFCQAEATLITIYILAPPPDEDAEPENAEASEEVQQAPPYSLQAIRDTIGAIESNW